MNYSIPQLAYLEQAEALVAKQMYCSEYYSTKSDGQIYKIKEEIDNLSPEQTRRFRKSDVI